MEMNKVTADEVLAWIDCHHPDLCDCEWCVTTMNIIAVQMAIIKERETALCSWCGDTYEVRVWDPPHDCKKE